MRPLLRRPDGKTVPATTRAESRIYDQPATASVRQDSISPFPPRSALALEETAQDIRLFDGGFVPYLHLV